ncbi:MAG TPA: glyoxalase [Propionibacteriaceae bacterium]|nr:VOC family protein [Micropruina sp.]HBY24221.1 glyoxalase [Propionibacteriaceae bacterium]
MLRGPSTVSFTAANLPAARDWYASILGIEPYFEVPGYVEFRVGDLQTELGIIDAAYAGSKLSRTAAADPECPTGTVLFWHVEDVGRDLAALIEAGARELDLPRDRGEGFVTATVVDPFGNVLGLMHNPHYLAVREAAGR